MPKPMTFNLLTTEDNEFLTVVIPGQDALQASPSSHGDKWDEIIKLVRKIDKLIRKGENAKAEKLVEKLPALFDLGVAIQAAFDKLSDRVSVRSGKVFFDGDVVDDLLTKHIIKAYEEGANFMPLVRFFENLADNPLGHSREALYPFIERNGGLTITEDGMVVGYKIVRSQVDTETGEVYYTPTRNDGGGIVNGVEFQSGEWLRQVPGDVVEMPRSIVLHAPSMSCAEGLHVGTWNYSHVTGDSKFAVKFHPRDVVSVPSNDNKIRVCRYTVMGLVTEPYTETVLSDSPAPEPEVVIEDDDEETMLDGDTKPTLAEIKATASDDVPPMILRAQQLFEEADRALAAQRDALGRWIAGRPSQRDPKTGRFIG